MAQVSFSRSTSSKGNCVKIVSSESLRGTPEERIEQFQNKSLGFIEDLIKQGIDPLYVLPSQFQTGSGAGGLIYEEYIYPTIQNEFTINSTELVFGVHLRSTVEDPPANYFLTPGDVGYAGSGMIQFYIPFANKTDFAILSSTRANFNLANSGSITASITDLPATTTYTVVLTYSYDPSATSKPMNVSIVITGLVSSPANIVYSMPIETLQNVSSLSYTLPTLLSEIQNNVTITTPSISNTIYTVPPVDESTNFAPLPIGWYAGDSIFSGFNILAGTGAPSGSTGASGDYYMDLSNSGTAALYGPKTTVWPGSARTNDSGKNQQGYSFGATGTAGANNLDLKFYNLFQGITYFLDFPAYDYFKNMFSPNYLSTSVVEVNRRGLLYTPPAPVLTISSYSPTSLSYFKDFLLRKMPSASNPPAEILPTDPSYKAIQDLADTFWPILTKTSDYIASINEEECNPAGAGVRNTASDLCGKTCMEITASPATSL